MKTGNKSRSQGAKALKKRFSIFKEIARYIPVAILIILYITVKEKTKNIHRDINSVEKQKDVLVVELERLCSEYEKMNTYIEIKEFAQNKLSMKSPQREALCFNVYDHKGLFVNKKQNKMPKLFDKNIKLALLEMKELQINR